MDAWERCYWVSKMALRCGPGMSMAQAYYHLPKNGLVLMVGFLHLRMVVIHHY
jgi:hypothetical protein